MSRVTCTELIRTVANDTGCSSVLARKVVDIFFAEMRETLMAGDRVEIRNFGVWTVKRKRPNPNARNPKTGEKISVPARRNVHFKPGKVLAEALKEPADE